MKKLQVLTEDMKKKRLSKCRELLKRFTSDRRKQIIFSNEKLFTVQPVLNSQNDRIIPTDISTSKESGRIVGRSGHSKALMVWAAVTSDGKSDLVFIDKGIKINSNVYLNGVLIKELHAWIHLPFGGRPYTFQQDGVPAYKAR